MNWRIWLAIIFSDTLDSMGRDAIGLYFEGSVLTPDLGIGVIRASFHISGYEFRVMTLLIRYVSFLEIYGHRSLNIKVGI